MKKSKDSKAHQAFRSWLKLKRTEQLDSTMRDCGKKLGVPHSFVGKVETGERRLDVVEYVEYCKVLGINPIEGINIIEDNLVSKDPFLGND